MFCSNLVFFSVKKNQLCCGNVNIDVAAHTSMHTIAGPCRICAICFLALFFLFLVLEFVRQYFCFFSEGESIVLCRCEH